MKLLQPDEARCANGSMCLKRGTCLRWLDTSMDEDHPSTSFFVNGDPSCSGYIPVEANG